MTRTLLIVLAATAAFAQETVTIGILPLVDATGASGDPGTLVARTLQAEFIRSTTVTGRILTLPQDLRADQIDSAKALEIGRSQNTDYVLLGTILQAGVQESTKGGFSPSILRQSAGVNVRTAKASVILQAVVFKTKTGERAANLRVEGKSSQTKVSGTAYTSLGSWGNNNYQAFLESPLGKAIADAVANLVKETGAAVKR
jgi:hypothetical protein